MLGPLAVAILTSLEATIKCFTHNEFLTRIRMSVFIIWLQATCSGFHVNIVNIVGLSLLSFRAVSIRWVQLPLNALFKLFHRILRDIFRSEALCDLALYQSNALGISRWKLLL